MANKYCVYKRVKDNIPGFREAYVEKVQCFDNLADAERLLKELDKKVIKSEYHPGHGAGSGSIDTRFYIEEVQEQEKKG